MTAGGGSHEPPLLVDFAGEMHEVATTRQFVIGREGDLALDDNPFLHRRFLLIDHVGGLWWVRNIGGALPAQLTDEQLLMRSTLAPGAHLPLVFPRTLLTFAAGSTSYELVLQAEVEGYRPSSPRPQSGDVTIKPSVFTESQLLCVLALAEPVLRRAGSGTAQVPTAVEAARRLGWAQTRFNRKLDNVCDKLTRAGLAGLRGEVGSGALNRRLLVVEWAVASRLVTAADLPRLDRETRLSRARPPQGVPG